MRALVCLAYAYLLLPCMLFLLGWVKWYISIPLVILMCVGVVRMRKDFPVQWHFGTDKKIIGKIVCIIGIMTVWVMISGVGGLVYQNSDHGARNTIFEILVNYDWPVVYEVISTESGGTAKGLIYYIGFWMPAAVAGKVFGLAWGYYFQVIWALIGLLVFYYLVCMITRKVAIWPLVVFIFFSGLDAVGDFVIHEDVQRLLGNKHIEWWMSELGYQFSGFTTQLFWVFNQAIPSWVVLGLMMVQNRNRHIALMMSTAMLSSTFPFVGLIPFAVYMIFSRKYKDTVWFSVSWWKKWVKDTISVENLTGVLIAFVFLFYLTGNRSANKAGAAARMEDVLGYLLFLLLEVGIYYLLIWKCQRKNPLYIVSAVCLCICPFIYVGSGSDFCMRVSIPSLIVLYLMVVQTMREQYHTGKRLVLCGLLITILIGSVTALHEIGRTLDRTCSAIRAGQSYAITNWSEEKVMGHNNFAGNVEDSVFYQYLAR